MRNMLIGLLVLCAVPLYGQGIPRHRLHSATTHCDGVRCHVVYEDWETSGHTCSFVFTCASVDFCQLVQTLYSGWSETKVFTYEVAPGETIKWHSLYPHQLAVYCDPSRCHLRFKLEAKGISSWYGGKSNGDVTKVMLPTLAEVIP